MTQDEIIEMAREAGLYQDINVSFHQALRNFYDLVAAKEQKKWQDQTAVEIHEAVLEERERIHKAKAQPDQEPVAIGDIRALKHRIHELEGEVIGYKRILDAQPDQEPVAFENWHKANYVQNLKRYGDTYKNIPDYHPFQSRKNKK